MLLSCQEALGEVGTRGSETDALCQPVMEVKGGDELGRGTHASQLSDFNDLYRTTAACSVSKLNKGNFPHTQKQLSRLPELCSGDKSVSLCGGRDVAVCCAVLPESGPQTTEGVVAASGNIFHFYYITN